MSIINSNWATMPADVIRQFFNYLEAKELIKCEKTCKAWQKIATESSFWKRFVLNMNLENHNLMNTYRQICLQNNDRDWKDSYKKIYSNISISHVPLPPIGTRIDQAVRNFKEETVNNEFRMLATGVIAPIAINYSGQIVKSVISTIISKMTFNILSGEETGRLLGGIVSVIVALVAIFFCIIGVATSDRAVGPLAAGVVISALVNAAQPGMTPGAAFGTAMLCLMVFITALFKR